MSGNERDITVTSARGRQLRATCICHKCGHEQKVDFVFDRESGRWLHEPSGTIYRQFPYPSCDECGVPAMGRET